MFDFAGENGRPSPTTRFFLLLGHHKLVVDRFLNHFELVLARFLWIGRILREVEFDSTAGLEDADGGEVDILAIDVRPAFHQKSWDLRWIAQRVLEGLWIVAVEKGTPSP